MAQRLNKKLVVAVTLFIFAMMIVLSVLMLFQLSHRDPKYFVELAREYEANEQWRPAALFYRKAWERSHDPGYLVARSRMLLNQGEVGPGLASLQTALINQPAFTDAHIRRLELLLEIARLYRKIEDWERVHDAAESFLESQAERTPEQSAFAHNADGMALISMAKRDEENAVRGEAELRTAVELAPHNVEYALDLAEYYVRRDRRDEGERIFKELIERHASPGPEAAVVRTAFAQYLASRRRYDEAERYFQQGLVLAEGDAAALRDARLRYAVFLSQQWARAREDAPASPATQALFDKAEAIFKRCIESDPDDFDPYLHLTVLYGSQGRHGDVLEICEARLHRGFSRKGVKGRRDQFNMFSLLISASTACIAKAAEAQGEGDQEQRENWLQRAEQYLADARGEFPSHPRVLSQSGRIKLARGLDREALDDFRAADEAYRSYDTIDWENKLALADLHLRLHEAGAARDVLEEVMNEARISRGHDIRFWILYAQALFLSNEPDRALAISDQVLAVDPDNPAALRLKAAVYERQGRGEEAGRILEKLTGDPVLRIILTSQQLTLEDNVEEGIKVLLTSLEQYPTDPRLVGAAIRALLNQGREKEARSVAETALSSAPENLHLKRLSILVREDLSTEERDAAMLAVIEEQEDAYQRALDLIGFYGRKRNLGKTLEYVKEALDHLVARDTPASRNSTLAQHRALLVAQMRIAAALDDAEAMEAAREAAVRFNVDGAGGKSIVGLYHMLGKEYDKAVEDFRAAIEAQPTDSQSLVRLAQCMHILGRTDEAYAWYQRAIRLNANNGEAYKGLASLARQRGDEEAYQEAIAACRRLIPGDSWVQAQLLAQKEEADPRAAIRRREKLLDTQPDDVDNLKRLVELCEAANDLPKADGFMDRLLRLRPDDKNLVVMAGRYYRRTGRPDRSLEVTTHYVESRPSIQERANAMILIASHYLGLEQLERVESTLLEAASKAETLEVTKSLAEFYLQRLNEPGRALPWFDKAVEYAREKGSDLLPRLLAARISCLLHRRLDDTDKAREYVDELRTSFPDYPQGLLLESEVHARQGRIEEAIDSLSDYLIRNPNDPYALYQRALHYRAHGRPAAALEDLQAIKRVSPLALDLRPRFLLARLHQQAGRDDLRIRELESLVQDAPHSAEAIEELARAYIDAGRPAEAERIVTTQINRAADRPEPRWFFLRGRISMAMGDSTKALADYRQGAEADGYGSGSIIKVMDLFLRLDRPSEGVEYFRRYARTDELTAPLVSRYALLLVRAGQMSEAVEQFRRAMSLATKDAPQARAAVNADLSAAFALPRPGAGRLTPPSTEEAITLFESNPPPGELARANDRILVRLYRAAGRPDDAAAGLEKLIAASADASERVELLFELGELYQSTGNLQRARRAYEEGLEFDSDNWMALNNLAYLLSDGLGEFELARAYARRAVVIADNSATLDTLGWIYVGLGEYSPAVAELSRAVRLAPGDPLAYYHLGEAYRRNGQFMAAESILVDGKKLAENNGDADLAAKFSASLESVARADRTP